MEHLLALDGVSVPVASAILTLLDPRRYGVLDIRAWQMLSMLGAGNGRRGFTVSMEQYLGRCGTRGARARRDDRAHALPLPPEAQRGRSTTDAARAVRIRRRDQDHRDGEA
jgi:hypothetical protein